MVLNSQLARRVRKNKRLRPYGIAAYRLAMRLRPGGTGPRVVANSIPKAGTHVLMSLLDAVPGMRFSGLHFGYGELVEGAEAVARQRLRELDRVLGRLGAAQYMSGHIRHRPDVVSLLAQRGVRTLVCVRDPRDIALSWAIFLESNTRHPLHDRFMADFPDLDGRIEAVITGVAAGPSGPELAGLRGHLDRYLGWLAEPTGCVVRYEDLVGPRGGGSENAQQTAVARVLAFIGLADAPAAVRDVAGLVYSTTSATFRRGQIGGWREGLAARHRDLIEDLCGDQMQALGYPP